MRIHLPCAAVAALLLGAESARAQYYMVPDLTGDRIMLFNKSDGAALNPFFITDDPTSTNYDFKNPWDAIQVGSEIWVTDFTSDQLIRFDTFGQWISTISTGIDNPRGMALTATGTIYMCNGGSQHGAPGQAIIAYNPMGVKLFHFAITGANDILDHNGELLVSNYISHDIVRYSYSGTMLGNFVTSDGVTGIAEPAQIAYNGVGRLLAAGYAGTGNNGLYEYDTTGTQTHFWNFGAGAQGLAEIDNHDILFADGIGVHIYEMFTGAASDVLAGFGAQYVNPLTPPPPPTAYCTAGTTSHGCVPQISSSGAPSANHGSGFNITVSLTEGQKNGMIFYGINGRLIQPWGAGSTSFLCIKQPVQRTTAVNTGGTLNNCNGSITNDWAAFITTHPGALGTPFSPGTVVDTQGWVRDPGTTKNTNLTSALEFIVQP